MDNYLVSSITIGIFLVIMGCVVGILMSKRKEKKEVKKVIKEWKEQKEKETIGKSQESS